MYLRALFCTLFLLCSVAVASAGAAMVSGGEAVAGPSPSVLPDLTLDPPVLLSPHDGEVIENESVTFSWTAVTGAGYYVLEIGDTAEFANPLVHTDTLTSATLAPRPGGDGVLYWRVRAGNTDGEGPNSEARSFIYAPYPDFAGQGQGIVEVTYPGVPDVCADAAGDPGCESWGGNTVWLDPNSTGEYLITAPGGPNGTGLGTSGLGRYIAAAVPDDYELRFTEACEPDGACLGFYGLTPNNNEVVSVPFELWNTGLALDPGDDVRMIPIILPEPTTGDPVLNWEDTFTATQTFDLDGDGTPETEVPVTHRVYWMMPDRPEGYDLFYDAAVGFGGPGAVYDREADGDGQVDVDPSSGEPCDEQGAYIDFCYEGAGSFVYPIGRMFVGDLAMDGTTPEPGVTVRFLTTKALGTANEPTEPGTLSSETTLLPVYPNPLRDRAVVLLEVPVATLVRVAVYDLLGREVMVLLERELAAERQEVVLDGRLLPRGTYIVRLEAGEHAATGRVTVVR
jgi:hypothetical protein